jgi:RimJ/RimL family protein N-acetyltransferase
MRYIGRPFSRTWAAASLRATIEAAGETAGPRFFVIVERRSEQSVGLCSVRPTSDDRCREIGIMLVRAARGRGLSVEAFRMLVEAAFRTLPIKAVSVQYRSANAAMSHVCDRLGFSKAPVRSGARLKTCVRMLRRLQWHKRFHQPSKGKAMSNIIGFLEQAGRDAALRHATREQVLRRMGEANIEQTLQEALLQPQRAALAALIGTRDTMYCQNQSIEPPKTREKAPAKKAPAKKAPAKAPPKKKKAPAKKPAKKAPPKRKR